MLSIDRYISEIHKILNDVPFSIWKNLEIENRSGLVLYLKGSIKFINETELFFKEYILILPEWRKTAYSYHFQDEKGNLIFRNDNASHHPEIATYPFHKHAENKILPSINISLKEVVTEIVSILS